MNLKSLIIIIAESRGLTTNMHFKTSLGEAEVRDSAWRENVYGMALKNKK